MIEVYFVFKENKYLQRCRNISVERDYEFSTSMQDIHLMSEQEAMKIAAELDAAVGSQQVVFAQILDHDLYITGFGDKLANCVSHVKDCNITEDETETHVQFRV